ncbi:MAG: ADP-ribose pyrophosphatase YjhB (NUDIX family) [Gammaproteobacteria bacterium]|jgi:ADP-ribose pyrophosphatase YjhB (NUDIX family)
MSCDQDWCPHVTVATVVERDGKFLVVEEIAGGEPVINQPAGHLDDGESLAHAAIRETFEETAWKVQLRHVCGVYRWRHPENQQTFIRVSFAAKAVEYVSDSPLDNGILSADWYSRDELEQLGDKLRSPMVLKCVDDYLAGNHYPLELLQDVL